MTIDIPTMSLVVAVASLLHAIVLVSLCSVARRYRGVGLYTLGTLLTALGFICFILRSVIYPNLLIFRFIGNVAVTIAQIAYTVGILRFLGYRERQTTLKLLLVGVTISQFCFTYIFDSYLCRNSSIVLILIASYSVATKALLTQSHNEKTIFNYLVAIILISCIAGLGLRLILIPRLGINALFQQKGLNIFTLWLMFLVDYLRNMGFTMMVTQRLHQDLKAQACLDFLTDLPNRRAIPPLLKQAIADFQKSKIPFSIVLLDIDRFKQINDNYGHDGGDAVLRHLSQELKSQLRSHDVLSRWGGEEFLLFLPKTPLDCAQNLAERLRQHVETHPAANGLIPYTISLGVASIHPSHLDGEAVVTDADRALYQAKNGGRNCVVTARYHLKN